MFKQKTNAAASLAALVAAAALALPPAASAEDQPGMVVVRDPETGLFRMATPAEMQVLRAQAAPRGFAAPKPAPSVKRSDGSSHKHLGESALVYSVTTRDADGKLQMQCVQGEQAAEAAVQHGAGASHTEEHSHAER